ncbi:MAG: hypothetical protein ACRDZ8_18595, partial [Acidimicrobiales bacterium]
AFNRPDRVGPSRPVRLPLLSLLPVVGTGDGRAGRRLGVEIASCWRAALDGTDPPVGRRRRGDSSGASRFFPSAGDGACDRSRSGAAFDPAGRGDGGDAGGAGDLKDADDAGDAGDGGDVGDAGDLKDAGEPVDPPGRCRSDDPVGAARLADGGRGRPIGWPGMA